jgi:hypothetical protein
MRPVALVISPFASVPPDAGHRRRVHQMTKLLADAGYGVTFLLLAFEDDWAWAHDEALHAELRAVWEDVIVVHASGHVGRPPTQGALHHLDEWWEPALETTLVNLSARRFFDVVVVHNVWLSKAFDFVHPASVKVLETHDLFWKRREAFARIGLPPSFFVTDQASELFGLGRADIVVTIQAAEARELLALTPRRVVNVPFYDPALHDAADATAAGYLHPEKVSFGFLASANPFNIHGLNALLAALETEIGESFAPVELVIGGSVGRHAVSRLPLRRLGRVPSERGFYAGVDYAIAPVFEGTGFKIKTADALALARPLLAAGHAADGVALDPSLVCADPAAMARLMARIALHRPDPRRAAAHVRRAREGLRARAAEGEAYLLRAIATAAQPVIIDLHTVSAETATCALRLQCWLGVARVLAGSAPVLIVLAQSVRLRVIRLLPPGVRAIAAGEVAGCLELWPRCRRVEAGTGAMPPMHPNLLWEAAALRLREMWAETTNGRAALAEAATLVILREHAAAATFAIGPAASVALIDATESEAVARVILRLLIAPGGTAIVCAAAPSDVRRMFLDLCALRGLAFHGVVDDAALSPGLLPEAAARELARRAELAARALIPPSSNKEPLCLAA